MEGILKVNPEELIAAAGEFSTQGSNILNLTQEMMEVVTGLSASWEGEAGTAYVTKFQGLEDDIQKLVAMVNEHASDLEVMAETYRQGENANQETISTLSSDIIS